MILKCNDGPMTGAVYVLSRNTSDPGERSTNRKPDGMWFEGQDETGNWVKHHYEFDRNSENGTHLSLDYKYVGPTSDTVAVNFSESARELAECLHECVAEGVEWRVSTEWIVRAAALLERLGV